MADKFFIAPYDKDSGLTNNTRPWLIPDSAFSQLTNAYVYRGRVRKRFGSQWLANGTNQTSSRLRVNIGTTDAMGDFSGSTPTGVTPAIGQLFSVGTDYFTVYQLGTPATMYSTDITAAGTYNTSSRAVVIDATVPLTAVFFYPSLPVVGLVSQEGTVINDKPVIAFDTSWAYKYGISGWNRISTETNAGDATWTGSDAQYFWGANWTGVNASDQVLFITNNNPSEPNFMRYLTGGTWTKYRPIVLVESVGPVTHYLNSCRIFVVFKNRLLALNTWEGTGGTGPGTNYGNRARWTWIGSPIDASGEAWQTQIAGRGGGVDAPTTESIITAQFVKDKLIVYFENSTFSLNYTGNEVKPFQWEKINNELGAESTFSEVPFDRVALGIGSSGVHACNGANVQRIDNKIPGEVFKIRTADSGVFRVYGIRDYYTEMVYWTFPDESTSSTQPFPNKVMLYNYSNGTWAFADDSITCFGYLQDETAITWDSEVITWDDSVSWDSGELTAQVQKIIAGNQQGFTFIVNADHPKNAPSLQITALTVSNNNLSVGCLNHNFRTGDYVMFTGITGTGNLDLLNYNVYKVIIIGSKDIFTCAYLKTTDVIAGTYSGGGLIQNVSKIQIKTKEYNFYAEKGFNAFVSKIDFMVDRTATGQIQVDYYVSTDITSNNDASGPEGNDSMIGTGTLDTFPYDLLPYEKNSTRLWHPLYITADGECIQLHLSMNDEQLRNVTVETTDGITSYTGPAFEDFQLGAMCITAQPSSSRLQ